MTGSSPFFQGSYFDTALLALARWPFGTLPVLSIVQDSNELGTGQKPPFAQPMVFFRLDACLSLLLHSPSMALSLKSLRLRIPARPIARPLCSMMQPPTSPYSSDLTPLPDLEFLDISTCSLLANEFDMILVRFPSLKHLILDGCSFLRGEGDWNDLGKRCALAGVRRAKQKEQVLKSWVDANRTTEEDPPNQGRRAKRGRKGLATATISLRGSLDVASTASQLSVSQVSLQRAAKIRILPSLPTLKTLSITVAPWVKPDKFSMLRAEFEAGWAEGMALLAVTEARLMSGAKNRYQIMRFSSSFEFENSQDDSLEEGLEGLENVGAEDRASSRDNIRLSPPVLCFSGPGRGPKHEENCGHSVAWEVMKDEL